MRLLRPLILITIIISVCFSNEYFYSYSLNQSLIDSIPAKPVLKKASFGIIAAEFGGGYAGWLVGGSIGCIGGILLALPFQSDSEELMFPLPITRKQFFAGLVGGIICGTLGCAIGTHTVGNHFDQRGGFTNTLLGSLLGWLIPIGGPPAGSVIFYNMSRPKTQEQSFFDKYFDPPSFSFRTEKTKENKIIPVYDFRLLNARF